MEQRFKIFIAYHTNEENIATAPVQNTSENSNTTTKEPTEEEWQASYRQIQILH